MTAIPITPMSTLDEENGDILTAKQRTFPS